MRELEKLEAKIAAWRTRMTAALPGQEETVRELEAHLRDHVEAKTRAGMTAEVALAEGVARMGEPRAVAGEFERLATSWFGGIRSRGARALAYLSGILGVVGFTCYLAFSIWGFARLMNGRALPPDPRWAGFWQVLAAVMAVASWCAIRASHRFLMRPSAGDLRGVVAFNLLALWMVTVQMADSLPIPYGTKVAALITALGVVALIWHRSVAGERDVPDTST